MFKLFVMCTWLMKYDSLLAEKLIKVALTLNPVVNLFIGFLQARYIDVVVRIRFGSYEVRHLNQFEWP